MRAPPSIVFHVHLVQDVAILQPLMKLARSLPGSRCEVLVSAEFAKLDATGRWATELSRLCAELDVPQTLYASEYEAYRHLQDKRGLIIAGSESNLPNHAVTHRLFASAPSSFTTITLQHGFECVGFLHNVAHDASAGLAVRFAADVIVGWFAPARLSSITASERAKLYVAGPPAMIEMRPRTRRSAMTDGFDPDAYEGMVCENLHSVRFKSATTRSGFLEEFTQFERRVKALGTRVHLRSHPAGQFTEKNAIALEACTVRSTQPLYQIDLTRFAYAISAPSSILFDFMLAGVPVAVWHDGDNAIDLRNFASFARVSTAENWWRFAVAASADPGRFVSRQDRFIRGLLIPDDVHQRYAALLSAA